VLELSSLESGELPRSLQPVALAPLAAESKAAWVANSLVGRASGQRVLRVGGSAGHEDGAVHETGRLAGRFGQRLHGRFNLPVEFIDERLTSHAADAALREGGAKAGRRAAMLDAAAAAEILRTWFETPPQKNPL